MRLIVARRRVLRGDVEGIVDLVGIVVTMSMVFENV